MATLSAVLRNVIDDIIENRVGAATESDAINGRFHYHGDTNDEGVATPIRENTGSARLFVVEFTGLAQVAMIGSTLQNYDVETDIVIGYPATNAGAIAAAGDWAAILANLNNGSWSATGLSGYQTEDEPVLETEDDWTWLVISTRARIEASLT